MTSPRIGSLCSGYGGYELAVTQVLGGRVAWHAETDPDAATVLSAHWPYVPNLGDITTVDWAAVEPVDVLAAGYPCQPESDAGRRRSTEDERWIWPAVATAVRVLRPRLVLLENVAGHLGRGLPTVVGDLAAMGYVGRSGCVRASDAGAPHRRERVFVAAWPADSPNVGLEWKGQARRGRSGPADRGDGVGLSLLPTPAARDGDRGAGWGDQSGRPLSETVMRLIPTPCVTDAKGARNRTANRVAPKPTTNTSGSTLSDWVWSPQEWGNYEPAIRRWERAVGRPAPAPTVPNTRGNPALSPLFVEWMQGLPEGWVTGHGLTRNACLRILGNGVVVQQGALALRLLLDIEEVISDAGTG